MNIGVIGCLPVSMMPTAPTDQEDCKKEPCEGCKCEVWTSKKKRELKEIHPEYLMLCMPCAIKGMKIFEAEMEKQGETSTVKIVDLGKK